MSTIIGEATKSEEYVPTITPTIKANINPRITSPPNKNITSRTKNVVKEVLTVLLSVLFNALFTNELNSFFLKRNICSLILSNTTTVSFKEYPIIVNNAAINA